MTFIEATNPPLGGLLKTWWTTDWTGTSHQLGPPQSPRPPAGGTTAPRNTLEVWGLNPAGGPLLVLVAGPGASAAMALPPSGRQFCLDPHRVWHCGHRSTVSWRRPGAQRPDFTLSELAAFQQGPVEGAQPTFSSSRARRESQRGLRR